MQLSPVAEEESIFQGCFSSYLRGELPKDAPLEALPRPMLFCSAASLRAAIESERACMPPPRSLLALALFWGAVGDFSFEVGLTTSSNLRLRGVGFCFSAAFVFFGGGALSSFDCLPFGGSSTAASTSSTSSTEITFGPLPSSAGAAGGADHPRQCPTTPPTKISTKQAKSTHTTVRSAGESLSSSLGIMASRAVVLRGEGGQNSGASLFF